MKDTKAEKALAIAFIAFCAWSIFIPGTRGIAAIGDEEVNVSHDNTFAKSYNITGEVYVKNVAAGLFNKREYGVNHITWPNGGTVNLDAGCHTTDRDSQFSCVDSDGNDLYVRILSLPDNN